jgi:hypothetical protein
MRGFLRFGRNGFELEARAVLGPAGFSERRGGHRVAVVRLAQIESFADDTEVGVNEVRVGLPSAARASGGVRFAIGGSEAPIKVGPFAFGLCLPRVRSEHETVVVLPGHEIQMRSPSSSHGRCLQSIDDDDRA